MSLISLLMLIAWPLIEIAVLIKTGVWLGFWWTLGIVIATAILGGAVLMQYGLSAALKVQEAMLAGEPPLASMMDGALVATAGILLITPGLCADAVGLLLLLPPLRQLIARILLQRILGLGEVRFETDVRRKTRGAAPGAERANEADTREGPVIDAEFERLDERTVDPARRPPGRDRGGGRER
jgi:UPF0716 protein FxsA